VIEKPERGSHSRFARIGLSGDGDDLLDVGHAFLEDSLDAIFSVMVAPGQPRQAPWQAGRGRSCPHPRRSIARSPAMALQRAGRTISITSPTFSWRSFQRLLRSVHIITISDLHESVPAIIAASLPASNPFSIPPVCTGSSIDNRALSLYVYVLFMGS